MITRRSLLAAAAATACGPAPEPPPPPIETRKTATILLRSGWQTENIGDIAHTPGVLRLLELYLSEAEIILWSNAVDRGVEVMLRRHFPKLRIVQGQTAGDGTPLSPTLAAAFEESDFLLHGSGPSVVARRHVEAWRAQTGKPYGIFGVTITTESEAASAALDSSLRDLLDGAEFVYTRETASLANLRMAGLEGEKYAFAPDGTFSLHIRDEERAKAFMEKYALESKKFIAVIPRLRYTPYHTFRKTNLPEEEIQRRTAVNRRAAEADHAKFREAITMWVRETGLKVLLCPEMTYQLEIIDPLLYLPLPDDVKKNVVRRPNYWLTDEAAAVYRRAVTVLSFECHSPIIAAANDTPCIYVRQPEDGIKGQMWKDVGLNRWYLQVEETTGQRIGELLLDIHANYASSVVDVHEAVIYARSVQSGGIDRLRKLVLG